MLAAPVGDENNSKLLAVALGYLHSAKIMNPGDFEIPCVGTKT